MFRFHKLPAGDQRAHLVAFLIPDFADQEDLSFDGPSHTAELLSDVGGRLALYFLKSDLDQVRVFRAVEL